MKIARRKPVLWRGPVFISDTKCEVWASIPRKLGDITKDGAYWYTSDNMRFVSSHDASQYLLNLHDVGQRAATPPAPKPQKVAPEKPVSGATTQPKEYIKTLGNLEEAIAVVMKKLEKEFGGSK